MKVKYALAATAITWDIWPVFAHSDLRLGGKQTLAPPTQTAQIMSVR